jgi:hypothetical protein
MLSCGGLVTAQAPEQYLGEDGQDRLFTPRIQVDIEVAVGTGLAAGEGVNARLASASTDRRWFSGETSQ